MAQECKSSKQGNTASERPVESSGVEMANPKELIIENFKKVEKSILSLTHEKSHLYPINESQMHTKNELLKYETLIMRFERALEIICNIFFRVVEMAEFGELSGNTHSCIIKMKHLSLITSEELWINMIMNRSNPASPPPPEEQGPLYEKILTLYIDELNKFCTRVKQRYAIPA